MPRFGHMLAAVIVATFGYPCLTCRAATEVELLAENAVRQRREIVSELVRALQEGEEIHTKAELAAAIRALGEYRAAEAAEILVG